MKTLEMYIAMFGEYPLLAQTMDYEDPIYQELMKSAIMDNKPITAEDLDKALKGIVYDVETKPSNKFGSFGKKE